MSEEGKRAAASEAVKYVENHTIIGVGTGSTVAPFIEALNERIEKESLRLKAAVTSTASKEALHPSVELIDDNLHEPLDLCVDGADRASKDFYLIKGGGGALLKEKYVAMNAKKNITIVDESKIATPLFGHPLPVEIVQFGYKATIKRINELGFSGSLRTNANAPFITEEGHFIFDIDLAKKIDDPRNMHNLLKLSEGVVETGLFLQTSDIIIIGKN
ncbi:ribose 5-phosphate isomerase A, partial [bacterium]|nr:ribose 5-phosphate isomerase A [bacterium]